MSSNPFESPQQDPNSGRSESLGKGSDTMPGAVTAISIICLILGILGLCGLCFQGLALAFQSSLIEFAESVPQPPAQKEFNRMNMDAQRSMIVPGIVLMILNLVVASLLVLGSIGCFKRKSSGRSRLRLGLLAAIFFSIIKFVMTVVSYFVSVASIQKSLADYQGEVPVASLEKIVQAGNIGAIVGCAFGSFFILAIGIFYVWARFYLGKQKLDRFFC